MRVLVVTKSFCGYVSNQVQYNIESALYLGSSYFRSLGNNLESSKETIRLQVKFWLQANNK